MPLRDAGVPSPPPFHGDLNWAVHTLGRASVLRSHAFKYTMPVGFLAPSSALTRILSQPSPFIVRAETNPGRHSFRVWVSARNRANVFSLLATEHERRVIQVSKEDPSPKLTRVLAFEFDACSQLVPLELNSTRYSAMEWVTEELADSGVSVRSGSEHARVQGYTAGRCGVRLGTRAAPPMPRSLERRLEGRGSDRRQGEHAGGGLQVEAKPGSMKRKRIRESCATASASVHNDACISELLGNAPLRQVRVLLESLGVHVARDGSERGSHIWMYARTWENEQDSALCWSAEIRVDSKGAGPVARGIEADGVMAGAGVAGRHSSRLG
ncbi:hypothetical protein B0H13DRAFT_1914317 [Mycena leptocephala]|nr:hypothetical protein B0H13DRAFT_1914317 [Mycena leptocephala]